MADTLLILPTIGANVEMAASVIRAALPHVREDDQFYVKLDQGDTSKAAVISRPGVWLDWTADRTGLVAAYRAGFAKFAQGPASFGRLVLLEDGLVLTDGWYDALHRTLDAHPHFGWVACGQIENDKAPFTSLCSMMTREAALALDGGPDLAFAPCQFDDGDMFMRLLAKGFTPHAVDHKVSHPEARTSRVGTVEDDWALIEAHRVIFQQRWGIPDFRWDLVPVHRGCATCA